LRFLTQAFESWQSPEISPCEYRLHIC
jgi:hypothetical protein